MCETKTTTETTTATRPSEALTTLAKTVSRKPKTSKELFTEYLMDHGYPEGRSVRADQLDTLLDAWVESVKAGSAEIRAAFLLASTNNRFLDSPSASWIF